MDDSHQIESKASEQVLTNQTILNYFTILESSCKYSEKVTNKLFASSSLLDDLAQFVMGKNW